MTDSETGHKCSFDKSTDWLINHFNVNSNTRVADFGCGPGFYTTAFAEAGAKVIGIDFSKRSIDYAKEQARLKNLSIHYVMQNYLDFVPREKYDLITLIYCDFCPLSPGQRSQLLNIIHTCLKDGGKLFLDVSTLQRFNQLAESSTYAHRLLEGFWTEEDYYGFLNSFKYEQEKVSLDKYTIIEKTRTWQVYNWMQHFDKQSLTEELEQNGFAVEKFYSDVAGKPFSETTPEMAVTATKRL